MIVVQQEYQSNVKHTNLFLKRTNLRLAKDRDENLLLKRPRKKSKHDIFRLRRIICRRNLKTITQINNVEWHST